MKLQYALLILLFIAGCAPLQLNVSHDAVYKKWMIKSMDGITDTDKLLKSAAYLDFSRAGNLSAKAGCNGLGATCKYGPGNKLVIGRLLGTQMYCEEFMPLENQLVKLLPAVDHYTVQGRVLYLYDKQNKLLIKAEVAE